MSRRPRDIEKMREARENADAARRRMLDRFKDHQANVDRERQAHDAVLTAKRNRFGSLSIPEAILAARRLSFVDLEAEAAGSTTRLNRPTLAILELFLRSLQERVSVGVLQWPRGLRDISILHPLAMLAILGSSSERATGDFKWSPAVPDFRTLYYPWRGSSTGIAQRHLLVDRNEIVKRNGLHLTRRQVGEAEFSNEMGKVHITLGHLHQLKLRDSSKPHLAHPTLGELYPIFSALGGEGAPRPFRTSLYELFGRVRHGAALDRLQDHRAEISQPATAPFAFFGICPRSTVKAVIQNPALTKGRSADICILDLGPPGLARVGPGWEDSVTEFIQLLARHQPETPIFAVTQDVYVHRRLTHMITKVGLPQGSKSYSASSRIIVRSTDDCFATDADVDTVSEVEFQFLSTSGKGAAALRALSRAARESSDSSAAGLIRHLMGNVRRAMSLPCGLKQAHQLLGEKDAGAEVFLERRSAGTVLAVIARQIEGTTDSAERAMLAEAKQAVEAAFDEFENDTPIGSMLSEIGASVWRKSSSSVIAFSSDYELLLGQDRILGNGEYGESVKKRIESGFIRLVTLQTLDLELAQIESGRSRNSWKRLFVIAPPQDQLAVLIGRRWLPDEVVVVADREFVDRLGATYAVLSSHADLSGAGKIGSRLANAAAAATAEARARDVGPVELELDARAYVQSNETIIDLTDSEDGDGGGEIVEFALESGRVMRVRPGGLVIRHNRFADVNPFERAIGREIAAHNTIVVPNRAFVEEARTVLPVRILAQTRVQVYHAAVEAAIPALPGASRAAKARYVIERLKSAGARAVVEATAMDWLNVAEHKLVSAERMRPHAPQNYREFRAFMEMVNVPSALAEKLWQEGIEPLRIDRRRAGTRMAQAFVSVLVDPHGVLGSMPSGVKEGISRLRRRAMEHLDGVVSVRRQEFREEIHA